MPLHRRTRDHGDDTPDITHRRAVRIARVLLAIELDIPTKDLCEVCNVTLRTAQRDAAYTDLVRGELGKLRERWRELLEIKRLAGEQ